MTSTPSSTRPILVRGGFVSIIVSGLLGAPLCWFALGRLAAIADYLENEGGTVEPWMRWLVGHSVLASLPALVAALVGVTGIVTGRRSYVWFAVGFGLLLLTVVGTIATFIGLLAGLYQA